MKFNYGYANRNNNVLLLRIKNKDKKNNIISATNEYTQFVKALTNMADNENKSMKMKTEFLMC